ncbi:MAG: ZIP family metal transporter [Candidatus Pacebacteria bacterium]|nr:ZIP family metal transporter [Candidatus Paceibacterota bacterium]
MTPAPIIFLIAIATCCSTLLGGSFALRLKDHLHLILGFSAGAVIGVAFFDLMPESLQLATTSYPISAIVSLMALGFLTYLVLDRMVSLHSHTEEENSSRENAGATTLSVHSFLDGVGIGLGFHVSAAIGAVVAAAVLAHDFSDGINTVNMVLKNGGDRSKAFRWLVVDAIAPVAGVAITFFVYVAQAELGLLLALFAGFFLYIGASDLIPESYHEHPVRLTTVMTVLGAAVIYAIIAIAG